MLAEERRKIICEMLKNKNAVTTSAISKKLNVSIETIRKDFLYLEKSGMLTRVHGGAIAPTKQRPQLSFSERLDDNKIGKKELSQLAATLVNNGDIISIDSGSTAIEFIKILKEHFDTLTIVTNSADVFDAAKNYKNFKIILCGGYFMEDENAFYGSLAIKTLDTLHVNKAFVFPSAVSLQNGICSYDEKLFDVQRKYFEFSDECIILADSGKFEKSAMLKLSDMNERYTFITDSGLGDEIKEIYKDNNIKIITTTEDFFNE